MKLKTVTITGADDKIDPYALLSFSRVFPFVEWGLLFSKSRQGMPRYPSEEWTNKLFDIYSDGLRQGDWPAFSAHLCGAWTRDIISGDFTFNREQSEIMVMMRRFQLNVAMVAIYDKLAECDWPIEVMKENAITQLRTKIGEFWNPLNLPGVPFFDASGGRGELPQQWPKAYPGVMNGYGGGLTPINLAEQLQRISQAAGDSPFWIDFESGVRTNDEFDLEKVRSVLEVAKMYVE